MTEQYSQTVEVTVTSKTKAMQWIGIGSVLFSLGFLMLAIFYVWYFVFGFIAILAVGIVYIHLYNTSPKEFIYDISPVRLVVAKKDLMGKTVRKLSLMLEDVKSLELMQGIADDDDVIACDQTYDKGVYQLVYGEDGNLRRLLFAPDDYMLALLKEALRDKFMLGSESDGQ